MAYLAYDLEARRPYSQVYGANDNGYLSDMRELSPLLLLGLGDSPKESDYQTLLDAKSNGRPFPGALGKDLNGVDVGRTKLARRLLSDLRAYPIER